MINFSSTSTSNRTSRCRRGRRGCMIGVDVLINECPSGRVTCSTRSWQPLEVVYRLLRHSLEGCSRAMNVVSTHQSSYPTPPIERSGTNPSGISSVCAKRTIGLEIILDTMMVLLRDDAQVDARFGPFGDSANLETR